MCPDVLPVAPPGLINPVMGSEHQKEGRPPRSFWGFVQRKDDKDGGRRPGPLNWRFHLVVSRVTKPVLFQFREQASFLTTLTLITEPCELIVPRVRHHVVNHIGSAGRWQADRPPSPPSEKGKGTARSCQLVGKGIARFMCRLIKVG